MTSLARQRFTVQDYLGLEEVSAVKHELLAPRGRCQSKKYQNRSVEPYDVLDIQAPDLSADL